MEFGEVELAAVVNVGERPDARKIVFGKAALGKDLSSSLPADETGVLSVPGAEDGVVALLLSLAQRPRDARLLGLNLLEGLLERHALGLELRGTACTVRGRDVERHERTRHHLQPRIDKARRLSDEGTLARETSGLGHEAWTW
jgi:hypothetical protein